MSVDVRKRVLILVEFKQRDLPGIVRIKTLLEDVYGHSVAVAPPPEELVAVPRYRPHLVLYSHLRYPASVERARRLRAMGIGVGVLPTEGMSTLESVRLVCAGQLTDLTPVDMHFVWNDTMAGLTHTAGRLASDRIHVTSTPRFDFYFPPLSRVHMTRDALCRKYGWTPDRPIVSWASNFGWSRLHGKEDLIRNAVVSYAHEGVSHLFPWDDIPSLVEREAECRGLQAGMFLRLAAALPEVNFMLRPHPVEDVDWYVSAVDAAGLRNVAITRAEYIWDVLASTDVHLHRASCTTSHEAWLLGRPTIALMPYPDEWFFSQSLADGGDVAATDAELLAGVRGYTSGAAVPEAQQAARTIALRDWYSIVDGRSAERHAAVIDRFLRSRRPEPDVARDAAFFAERARLLVRRVIGLPQHGSISAWLRGKAYMQDRRDKFVTDADVDEWVARIRVAEAAP